MWVDYQQSALSPGMYVSEELKAAPQYFVQHSKWAERLAQEYPAAPLRRPANLAQGSRADHTRQNFEARSAETILAMADPSRALRTPFAEEPSANSRDTIHCGQEQLATTRNRQVI